MQMPVSSYQACKYNFSRKTYQPKLIAQDYPTGFWYPDINNPDTKTLVNQNLHGFVVISDKAFHGLLAVPLLDLVFCKNAINFVKPQLNIFENV